jgi:hypothetical protein
MIRKFPQYLAQKFQGQLKWLLISGAILLICMAFSSQNLNPEKPEFLDVLAYGLFSSWCFFASSIWVASQYFKQKPEQTVDPFLVQITSTAFFSRVANSRALKWLDHKWGIFADWMFLGFFYLLFIFSIIVFLGHLYAYYDYGS